MRYMILLIASLALLSACGNDDEATASGLSGSSEDTVTLSTGEVVTEHAYQSNIAALINDMGYAQICRVLAPNMDDDLGKSTTEDRARVIELHAEVCEQKAEEAR